jgi:hypothetical protein
MATKDWKPSQTSSGFYNKSGRLTQYLKFVKIPAGLIRDKNYSLHLTRGKLKRNLGLFKTKQQALAYAKKYMRNN